MQNLITRNNIFNNTPDFEQKKSTFDLSFVHPRDMEIGKLYPVGLIRTMPGDRIKCKANIKAYMESLIKNGFYNFRLNLRAYFSRIGDLDVNSKAILTGGPDGDFDENITTVYLHSKSSFKKPYSSLQDCFGLPLTELNDQLKILMKVSALPYILYDNIVFNYYINSIVEDNIVDYVQNGFRGKKRDTIVGLVDNDRLPYLKSKSYYRYFDSIDNFRIFLSSHGYPEVLDRDKYSDTDIYHFMYNVNYVKDRYTSSHISQQLGNPPSLPIDTKITFNFPDKEQFNNQELITVYNKTNLPPTNYIPVGSDVGNQSLGQFAPSDLDKQRVLVGNYDNSTVWTNLFQKALLASSNSFSVSDIRLAFQTQVIYEAIMLGGWEYHDYVKMFFGVDIKERVPYRPKYLGGLRKNFITSDIFSTVATQDTPLGSYAGRGQLQTDDFLFDDYFEDFGYIMILAYIDTDGCYYNSQGVKKHWLDIERFNYPNPAFYHLSMQGVERSELFINSATNTLYGDVFGYKPIYDEWRQNDDFVTGSLRDELSFWTSSRIFGSKPSLNSEFLKVKQKDYDRVFAVEGDLFKPFICAFGFSILAERNLPAHSIPGLIDHR